MSDNLATILAAPSSLVVLAIVLTGLISLLLRSGRHLTISELTTTAMLIALAAVLGYFRIFHMPQGGSVTLGSMLPLLMIAWRFGAGAGALAGFIYGLISLLEDPFIVQPVHVLFDYPLPFMAMGLAGLLPGHRCAGAALAFCGRFLCHVISGVAFFASYAPASMSPLWYSLTFNASYLVPELAICFLLLWLLPVTRLLDAMTPSRR